MNEKVLRSSQWRILEEFLREETPAEQLPQRAICLFVMGSPFIELPQHAARLFTVFHVGACILVTGKGDTRFENGCSSEAEYCEKVLLSERISPEEILVECKSTNTLENVVLGMEVLIRNRVFELRKPPHTIVVVAIPPMLRRALATFRRHFPDITIMGSAPRMKYEKYATPTNLIRIADEVRRLDEYGRKGDILPILIPSQVFIAAEAVKEMAVQSHRGVTKVD